MYMPKKSIGHCSITFDYLIGVFFLPMPSLHHPTPQYRKERKKVSGERDHNSVRPFPAD